MGLNQKWRTLFQRTFSKTRYTLEKIEFLASLYPNNMKLLRSSCKNARYFLRF